MHQKATYLHNHIAGDHDHGLPFPNADKCFTHWIFPSVMAPCRAHKGNIPCVPRWWALKRCNPFLLSEWHFQGDTMLNGGPWSLHIRFINPKPLTSTCLSGNIQKQAKPHWKKNVHWKVCDFEWCCCLQLKARATKISLQLSIEKHCPSGASMVCNHL